MIHYLTFLSFDVKCVMTQLHLAEITVEEKEHRQRAQEARALKAKVEEAKRTTVDDLTKGVVNYKFTGLDFEKTSVDNELRCVEENVDP